MYAKISLVKNIEVILLKVIEFVSNLGTTSHFCTTYAIICISATNRLILH